MILERECSEKKTNSTMNRVCVYESSIFISLVIVLCEKSFIIIVSSTETWYTSLWYLWAIKYKTAINYFEKENL